jgi:hypothetical protein
VYRRETGEPLIKGFIGSRAELLQKLEDPEFIQVYYRPRLLKRRAGDFPIESLGGFIHWYSCGAIDDAKENEVDGYPKWWKLAKSTREDYLDAFDNLRPEFDIVLKDTTQPALCEVRDTWPSSPRSPISRQPRDAGGDPREDRAPAAASTPASADLELQPGASGASVPGNSEKLFHRAPKSCPHFFPPRALIRHGYLQADTKHCLRAERR